MNVSVFIAPTPGWKVMYSEEKKNWSPADFVRLPTDKEIISL